MKRKALALFLLALIACELKAQTQYQKALSSDSIEFADLVCPNLYGDGYYIGGHTNQNDSISWNSFVAKINNGGDTVWVREFGEQVQYEWITSMIVTSDGGVVCYIFQFLSSNLSAQILKFDSVGTIVWTRRLGSIYQTGEIVQTSEGGYAASYVGFTGFGIIKLDAVGNIEWTVKDSMTTSAYFTESVELIQTEDHGYMMATSLSTSDVCVIRYDSLGIVLWNTVFLIPGMGIAYDLVETLDSNFILLLSHQNAPYSKVGLIKFGNTGAPIWQREYSSTSNGNEYLPRSLKEDTDGNLYFSAIILIGNSINKIELNKIDSDGSVVWSRIYGGNENDWPGAIALASDAIIIVGYTRSFGAQGYQGNIYLIKTDTAGFSGCAEFPIVVQSQNVQYLNSSLSITIGQAEVLDLGSTNPSFFDCILTPETVCSSVKVEEYPMNMMCDVFPSPANDHFTINLECCQSEEKIVQIIGCLGQLMFEWSGRNTVLEIESASWPSGQYAVICHCGQNMSASRIILQR